MATFVGDTLGQASQLYNNYEANQQAAAADAFNRGVAQRNLVHQEATQQGEFQQQMTASEQARQDAATYNKALLDLNSKRYQAEADWRKGQLDLQKRQIDYETSGKLPPNTATTLHINLGQQDAAQGFPDLPAGDVTPDQIKDYYGIDDDALNQSLASMGNAARTKLGADYKAAQHLAEFGNRLPHYKAAQADISGASTVRPAPMGAWINPLRWFGQNNRPDTTWTGGEQANLSRMMPPSRVNNLQAALAAAVQQGKVALDPTTGSYTPAAPPPKFLTGNRASVAGAIAEPVTSTATEAQAPADDRTVYQDKSGTRWNYRGTMSNPAQDTDPNNWEQISDEQ